MSLQFLLEKIYQGRGVTVSAIICVIAPLTQAGLNPARDFGPRIFVWMAGWGEAAFPDDRYGFLVIYVLAPLLGGATASILFVRFLEPMMNKKKNYSCCD